MDKDEALKIVKNYTDLLIENFKPSKIYLYGSFANGNWSSDSDIDVAVVVKSLKLDYLQSLSLLYKIRREINSNIEPTLFIEGKDPSGFLENIINTGEIIYSSN
ncbi:MAG: nucleotidyltransferase domain-containing protein [Candidatus Kapabacteria bacterium]|nr:nucleotidyltransferase domain-containing protein [Candidatus Kapabacteria bacterium]